MPVKEESMGPKLVGESLQARSSQAVVLAFEPKFIPGWPHCPPPAGAIFHCFFFLVGGSGVERQRIKNGGTSQSGCLPFKQPRLQRAQATYLHTGESNGRFRGLLCNQLDPAIGQFQHATIVDSGQDGGQ